MKTLSQCNWKVFTISDIFRIENSVRLTQADMRPGSRPFVGATEYNNGITAFVSNTNDSLDSNVLGVNYNGSVVENFYHPYEAVFSDDVKRLHFSAIPGNKYQYLFVKCMILQQKKKFQYGYKFNAQRMAKQRIMLPVLEDGTPDYDFMDAFMRAKEEQAACQIKNNLCVNLENLHNQGDIQEDREWKPFKLPSVFTIKATKSGIDKSRLTGETGKIPYITRTNLDNGWDQLINTQSSNIDNGNVISVGLDTQTAFYQPIPFYTGQNIQIFSSKHINKYVALFMIPLIKKQMEKFNWGGNGATLGRLKRSHIMLPTDANGEPDYDYMEKKMRYLEAKMLLNYYNSKFH